MMPMPFGKACQLEGGLVPIEIGLERSRIAWMERGTLQRGNRGKTAGNALAGSSRLDSGTRGQVKDKNSLAEQRAVL